MSLGLLRVSQKASINCMLERFNMDYFSPNDSPIIKGVKLSKIPLSQKDLSKVVMKQILYAYVVGRLVYAQRVLTLILHM